MIYIFSNAHSYDTIQEYGKKLKTHFESIDCFDDKFIMLNTCVPLQANKPYFKTKNVLALCRGFDVGAIISYWGLESIAKLNLPVSEVYCCQHSNFTLNVIKVKPNNFELKEDVTVNNDFFKNYPKDKVPTTGYIAYHMFGQLFPNEEITLVNFYGSLNNTTPKDACHKWDYEEEYFKDKNKLFI